MIDRELKPCPFCGGEGAIRTTHWGCFILCENCRTSIGIKDTEEDAINVWNNRPEHTNLYGGLEFINEIRKQTVLEFVERLQGYKCNYDLDNYHSFEAIDVDDIDEVVKEFLGENYDN